MLFSNSDKSNIQRIVKSQAKVDVRSRVEKLKKPSCANAGNTVKAFFVKVKVADLNIKVKTAKLKRIKTEIWYLQ